ncbi:MAG: DUF1573 domain-containing protein [Candidatus Krumholzibacteriia bacterium]
MRRIIACLMLLAPLVALSQPNLVLEPASLDFGTLAQQQTRDATVMLSNTGDAPLEITKVEATCGCTVPDLEVTTLGPGASTVMEVQFNSQHFQGHQLKFIKIYTDDPRHQVVDFQIQANIEVALSMEPAQTLLRFPMVRGGATSTLTYTFVAKDVSPLEIEPVSWPQGWLDIAVRPSRDPHSVDVDFTVRADSPPGTWREPLKLRTNVPDVPVVNLEADVRVVTDLILGMDRVNLMRPRSGQKLGTRVRVAPAEPGIEFKLTGAEVDIPGLTARVENGTRESFAVLEGVALAMDHPFAQAAHGRIAGTLRIHTNLPSSPLFEVPVTYVLRP